MRANGISYDTGFVRNGASSREPFDPEVVRRELRIIRDDLHANAVRIMGGDPERLELAAAYAAELGLEVWFSPYPLDLTAGELLSLFADCAERAERLRRRGAEVVFVAGAELSLMNKEFLPGDTFQDRLEQLLGQPQRLPELVPMVAARVNEFLAKAVAVVRERFGGRVTYAAIQLERVDWAGFDIVSMDLYRSAEVADQFTEGVRALVAQGKRWRSPSSAPPPSAGRGTGARAAWRSSSRPTVPSSRRGWRSSSRRFVGACRTLVPIDGVSPRVDPGYSRAFRAGGQHGVGRLQHPYPGVPPERRRR